MLNFVIDKGMTHAVRSVPVRRWLGETQHYHTSGAAARAVVMRGLQQDLATEAPGWEPDNWVLPDHEMN